MFFNYFDQFLTESENLFEKEYGTELMHHLKLTFVEAKPPPPLVFSQQLLMAAETGGEYSY